MDDRARTARIVSDTLAEAIEAIREGDMPAMVIARRLRSALRADTASYGWLDVRSGECRLFTWPEIADPGLMVDATIMTPYAHPVLGHWLRGNPGVAVVSQLVTDWHAWRNSEGYSLLKRGIGCTETGGLRLDTGRDSLHMIGFARDVDFTEAEVRLLGDMLQPTIAVSAHAAWVSRLRTDPQKAAGVLAASSDVGLTTRELEVLQHLATGMLATTIAARMQISVRTVHRHLSHLYRKLGTRDRLTTVLVAQRSGLVVDADPRTERISGRP